MKLSTLQNFKEQKKLLIPIIPYALKFDKTCFIIYRICTGIYNISMYAWICTFCSLMYCFIYLSTE